MTSKLRHLGCTVPATRAIAKAFARSAASAPADHVVKIALALVAQGVHDSRQAAYEILAALPEARDGLTVRQMEALQRRNDNWAAVDCFCSSVSGPQFAKGLLHASVLERWATSKDPWIRRTALATVATAFQRASLRAQAPLRPSMEVCALLVDDRHDHVVKSLSWALRNLSRREPRAVERFLQQHDGRLAPRVTREVRTMLTTGLKSKPKAKR